MSRSGNANQRFEPAEFCFTLISARGGQPSQILKSNTGNQFRMSLTLTGHDLSTLQAGTYMLMVDSRWNKVAEMNPQHYKQILVTASSPGGVKLSKMNAKDGY